MTPQQTLSDRAVSYLRTAVPIVWGTLVTYLLGWVAPHLPGELGPLLVDALGGEAAVTLVVAVAIAGWYGAWRFLEPRIPAWLVRVVLGSSSTPVYAPVVAVVAPDGTTVAGPASRRADGTPLTFGLTDERYDALVEARYRLPEGDAGKEAIAEELVEVRHLADSGAAARAPRGVQGRSAYWFNDKGQVSTQTLSEFENSDED